MNDNEIVIDPKSGISVEEQQEILTQINGITEKNRQYLSEKETGDGKKAAIKAKKSGAFFPLAVNISAVVVLLLGSLLLFHWNSMRSVQIRTGAFDYDLRLTGVQIETSDELSSAMRELERLTSEQDRINAIDALISGGLINISALIQEIQFDQAATRVIELRTFLQTDSLATSHAFQSRRTFYNQLLDFADTLIEDARRQFDLINLTIQQENTINDMLVTIDSLEAEKETLDQTILTRDSTISTLETQTRALNQTIEERDDEISLLVTERNTLNQTVSARDSSILSLETQRNTLNQTVAARESTITSLETQRDTLNQTVATRENTITSLRTQNTELEQQVENLNNQITLIRQAAGL